jgi:diguanylate cyclase (GGDEF)-like protein
VEKMSDLVRHRGSIQRKVVLTLAATAVLCFGGGTLAVNHAVVPTFRDIESRVASEEAYRVQRAIEEDCTALSRFVSEWATRDTTRWLLYSGTPTMASTIVDRTSLEALDLQLFAIVRADGSLFWGQEYVKDDQGSAPEWFVSTLRRVPLTSTGDLGSKGILISDDGRPLLMAFHTVRPPGGVGPTMGLVGRYMGADYQFSLFRRLRARLILHADMVGSVGPPVLETQEHVIKARLPMFDVFLDRGLTIELDVPRQFVPTIARALSQITYLMSGVAILVIFLLWFVLRREILIPVRQITRRIRNFAQGEGLRLGATAGSLDDLPVSRRDEVGEIAAEIAFLHDRIVELANRDPLTGISTRRPFQDRLGHALERAARYRHSVAVLFIDLDGFKPVNDAYGHAAGDVVLKAVARRIQQTLRKSDSIARMGGDEFAILLESPVTRESAEVVVAKVAEAIRTPIVYDDREIAVGASIGVAVYPEDGSDMESLIAVADKSMYPRKPHHREDRGPSPSLIVRPRVSEVTT